MPLRRTIADGRRFVWDGHWWVRVVDVGAENPTEAMVSPRTSGCDTNASSRNRDVEPPRLPTSAQYRCIPTDRTKATTMSDRSRWDPEMLAYQQQGEAIAAKFPPVKLELPLEPHRQVNDAITLARGTRGPEMAETTEYWVSARGRRIYCRVHRPRTERPLPVLVYFHGGGWVWGSVDTHDCAGALDCRGRRGRRPSASITHCRRRRSFRRRWRNAPPWCATSRARCGVGARPVMHPARAAIPPAATWRWRPRCCCATPAGQSWRASSRRTRCATAGSTRRAIRSSRQVTC